VRGVGFEPSESWRCLLQHPLFLKACGAITKVISTNNRTSLGKNVHEVVEDLGSRLLSIAWKILLIADFGVLFYGLLVVFGPDVLSEGFRVSTGQSWLALLSVSPTTAEYILLLWRLVGALNIAFAIVAIAVVLMSFRRGEAWSWYALLIGNTIGYGSPIAFDLTVGAIGIFEELEIIFMLLIYIALGISAKDILSKKRDD